MPTAIRPGQGPVPGPRDDSPGGQYLLIMQGHGNLAEYRPAVPFGTGGQMMWSSGT